ncbi:MAG: hypothetical protein MEEGG_02872 [Eggerthella lenta]
MDALCSMLIVDDSRIDRTLLANMFAESLHPGSNQWAGRLSPPWPNARSTSSYST